MDSTGERRTRRGSKTAMSGNEAAAQGSLLPEGPVAFEDAFAELEQITQRLDDGQLPLEEALRLYERGMRLAHACQQLLDTAELRVERLRGVSDGTDGARAFLLESFEVEE